MDGFDLNIILFHKHYDLYLFRVHFCILNNLKKKKEANINFIDFRLEEKHTRR